MASLDFAPLRVGPRGAGATPLLSVRGLAVTVGIRQVIDGLDLDLFEGDAIAVTGPNGAGKSTLLNAIAGLEPARIKTGSMTLDGVELTQLSAHERARQGLAYMRQRANVFTDLTVDENLRLALGPEGPETFRRTHPEWTDSLPARKRAGLLSGGERQRLAWAMATLRSSRLLLADEPEAGVSTQLPLVDGQTVLLVSHSPDDWLASVGATTDEFRTTGHDRTST